MDQAVEGLALEYRTALLIFFTGLLFFYLSATFFVFMEDFEAFEGILLLVLLIYFAYETAKACKRIYKKFRLTAEMAVAGSFGADGTPFMKPAKSADAIELEWLCANKRLRQWPRRQMLYLRVFWDEFLGISSSVQQSRYESSRMRGESTEKRYNFKIHNILRHLELPSHAAMPGARRSKSQDYPDDPRQAPSAVVRGVPTPGFGKSNVPLWARFGRRARSP